MRWQFWNSSNKWDILNTSWLNVCTFLDIDDVSILWFKSRATCRDSICLIFSNKSSYWEDAVGWCLNSINAFIIFWLIWIAVELRKMAETINVPCSVNAKGGFRVPPQLDVPNWNFQILRPQFQNLISIWIYGYSRVLYGYIIINMDI